MMVDNMDLVGVGDVPGREQSNPGLSPGLDHLGVVGRQLGVCHQLVEVPEGQESTLKVNKLGGDLEVLDVYQNLGSRIGFTQTIKMSTNLLTLISLKLLAVVILRHHVEVCQVCLIIRLRCFNKIT